MLYEHVDYAEIPRYDYYKKTSEQLIRDINAKIFKFNEDDQVAFRNNQEIKDEFNIVTETYKDIRLVGAPPQALHSFNNDTPILFL